MNLEVAMSKGNTFISVIIPVFNGETFAEKYIKSVLKQDYKNLEIIIINDGSSDNTEEILNNLAKCDNRIKIITHKVNQGVSCARNSALDLAQGEYIQFVDCDDEVVDGIYDELAEVLLLKPDMIIFDYYKCLHYMNISIKKSKKRNIKDNVIIETLQDKLAVLKNGAVVAWNKLYSRQYLISNQLKFVEGISYEDIPFFWESVLKAKQIIYVNKMLYLYNQRLGSIMNSRLNLNKAKNIVISMNKVNSIIVDMNFTQDHFIYQLFLLRLIKTYNEFFRKLKNNKAKLFYEMANSVEFVDLKLLKNKLSKINYLRFYLLKNKKYTLYYIISLCKLKFWK